LGKMEIGGRTRGVMRREGSWCMIKGNKFRLWHFYGCTVLLEVGLGFSLTLDCVYILIFVP
jgi:hypothetical protein